MSHLNDEQLGALADGALEGGARAAAERHLEGCAACREALAALLAGDRALREALEHDPGDAYFEDFSARVGARLRAVGQRGAQARAPEGRALAEWFRSPRKLATVGALATVVAGAGIVMLVSREVSLPVLHDRAAERRVVPAAPAEEAPALAREEPRAPATGVTAEAEGPATPAARSGAFALPPAPAADEAPAPERRAKGGPAPAADEAVATERRAKGGPALAAAPTEPVVQGETIAASGNELGAVKSEALARGEPEAEPGGAPAPRAQRADVATVARKVAADAFEGQTTFTSLHGRNALRLNQQAERMQVAPAWDSAAAEWTLVLLATRGGPLEAETRFQLAHARLRAWRTEATAKRATLAREAFADFLAMAPAGAQRDSVTAWSAAVGE